MMELTFQMFPTGRVRTAGAFFYFVLKHSEVLFIKPKHFKAAAVLIAIVLNPEAGERVGCKCWFVL